MERQQAQSLLEKLSNKYDADMDGTPWKNEDLLEYLYHDRCKTTYDIAELLGCSQPNIRYWLEKYGIETRPSPSELHQQNDAPWKDEATMRDQYIQQQSSIPEIADELGCSETVIWDWLERHDIEKRQPGRKPTPDALADKDELRKLYVKDNRSSLEIAELVDRDKSTVLEWLHEHGIEVEDRSAPEQLRDEEQLREMYREEEMTTEEIACALNCGVTTVSNWLTNHGIETRPPASERTGEDSPHWEGGLSDELDYGTDWEAVSARVREWDGYACVRCDMTQAEHLGKYGRRLPVHHDIPVREHITDGELNEAEAHRLDNLITVCVVCHPVVEGIPLDLRHRGQ